MPQLSALLDELEARLVAIYGDGKIAFGLGKKELESNASAPPRITWVPLSAKHGAAVKTKANPRSLLTREITIVAHCWAVDHADSSPKKQLDACESLVNNLCVVLHKAAWGSVVMGGEEWLQSDNADLGHVAYVTFTIQQPVADRVYQTVQPTILQPEVSGVAPGDNDVAWGEP